MGKQHANDLLKSKEEHLPMNEMSKRKHHLCLVGYI